MALENAEVLKNLTEQRETLEKQLSDGNAQIEQLKQTHFRISSPKYYNLNASESKLQ